MNTYDPSDRILYVHMSGPADARSAPADSATAGTVFALRIRLPVAPDPTAAPPRARPPEPRGSRLPDRVDSTTSAASSILAPGSDPAPSWPSPVPQRQACADQPCRRCQPFGVTAVLQEAPGTQQPGSPRAAVRLVQELAQPDRAAAATEGEGGQPTFCPRRVSSPEPSRSVPRLPGDAAYQPLTRPFCIGGSGDVRRTPALAEGE